MQTKVKRIIFATNVNSLEDIVENVIIPNTILNNRNYNCASDLCYIIEIERNQIVLIFDDILSLSVGDKWRDDVKSFIGGLIEDVDYFFVHHNKGKDIGELILELDNDAKNYIHLDHHGSYDKNYYISLVEPLEKNLKKKDLDINDFNTLWSKFDINFNIENDLQLLYRRINEMNNEGYSEEQIKDLRQNRDDLLDKYFI